MKKFWIKSVFVFLSLSCMMFASAQAEVLDYKGKAAGETNEAPLWLRTYIVEGLTDMQELYPDVYCVVGKIREQK
jgi:hypothetical protein